MMDSRHFLLDNWASSGAGLESFRMATKKVDEKTDFVKIISDSQLIREHDGVYHCISFEDGVIRAKCANTNEDGAASGNVGRFMGLKPTEDFDGEAVGQEAMDTTRLIFRFGGVSYFVSEVAYHTLANKLGLGSAIEDASYERAQFISKLMKDLEAPWTLCVRSAGKARKIFGVFSDKYNPIKQEALADVAENLCSEKFGKSEVTSWEITQTQTGAVVEFSEMADEITGAYGKPKGLIPAVRLYTGDTGERSFCLQACWKRKSGFIIQDEANVRHIGSDPTAAAMKTAKDKIFPTFSKLPERLVDLMEIDVTAPAMTMEERKAKMSDALAMVRKYIRLDDAISKANANETIKCMMDEVDLEDAYTAYDVAMMFLDLPDRLRGLKKGYVAKLSKAAGRAAFAPFEKAEKADELYLSA